MIFSKEYEANMPLDYELRVREKKVTAIMAEKTVEEVVEVVCVPQPPIRTIAIGSLEDFLGDDGNLKGGENMECKNHALNMCPAVGGNEKICPNCPHMEWVVEYKLFYARVMNEKAKEHYIAHGF